MQYTGKIKQILSKLKFATFDEEKIYDLEIIEHKEKRGLTANSYYQSLLNQLVDKLVIGREELHFRYIKDFSPVVLIPLLPNQNPKGYFKYYEEYKESKINDTDVIYYKVYKPSREMNSKEFWVLIKGVEQDCVQLGIETLEDKKLKQLLEDWERK